MGDPGICQVEAGDQTGYPGPPPVESSLKHLYLDTYTEAAGLGPRGKIQIEIKTSAFRSLRGGECMWAKHGDLVYAADEVWRESLQSKRRLLFWGGLELCRLLWLLGWGASSAGLIQARAVRCRAPGHGLQLLLQQVTNLPETRLLTAPHICVQATESSSGCPWTMMGVSHLTHRQTPSHRHLKSGILNQSWVPGLVAKDWIAPIIGWYNLYNSGDGMPR